MFLPEIKGIFAHAHVCIVACLSFSQARADYYYRVKLADNNGIIHQIGGKDWSDWIHVESGTGLKNALSKLVGETHSEQEKDNNGNLKFKYNDGKNEIYLPAGGLSSMNKNDNGNYIYKVGETEYVLNPVMKYSANPLAELI